MRLWEPAKGRSSDLKVELYGAEAPALFMIAFPILVGFVCGWVPCASSVVYQNGPRVFDSAQADYYHGDKAAGRMSETK